MRELLESMYPLEYHLQEVKRVIGVKQNSGRWVLLLYFFPIISILRVYRFRLI